jgi:amidophosphoribosyltransferase
VFASETCALDLIGATYQRDIQPGEMLVLTGADVRSYQIAPPEPKHCIFEFVYFSRPDSRIFGEYVDKTRRKLGKNLAIEKPAPEAEIVISVPDSSNTTAIGYSQRSTARFEIGLIRNHYIGRTFIHPTQTLRDFTAKIKFNTIGGVLKDRKVVVVDDSIVRGTTLRKLVRMLREAGASQIHIRIGSPPIKYPCYFGMDFPSKQELIANQKTPEEIKNFLDVDSLEYISPEGLLNSMTLPADQFCTACFTGQYCEQISNERRVIAESPIESHCLARLSVHFSSDTVLCGLGNDAGRLRRIFYCQRQTGLVVVKFRLDDIIVFYFNYAGNGGDIYPESTT